MSAPIHPKVTAATLASAAAGLTVWLLGRYAFGGHPVPAVVVAEVYTAVPAVLAFTAGYLRHAAPPAAPPPAAPPPTVPPTA